MYKEIAIFIVNVIGLGWFAWNAFKWQEIAEQYKGMNKRAFELNDDLIAQTLELNEEIAAMEHCLLDIESERERLQQMYDERPGMVEHRAAETILDALDEWKRLKSMQVAFIEAKSEARKQLQEMDKSIEMICGQKLQPK
jgi:hypothetical protein